MDQDNMNDTIRRVSRPIETWLEDRGSPYIVVKEGYAYDPRIIESTVDGVPISICINATK
jgi:hypothetical protein